MCMLWLPLHTPCTLEQLAPPPPRRPVHTYPHAMVSPDGGVWVSAGSSLVKYERTGETSFRRVLDLPDRPHAPWSYPQTGQGLMLPIFPPYDKIEFLAMGECFWRSVGCAI